MIFPLLSDDTVDQIASTRSRLKVQLGLHGSCQARQLPAAQDALVLEV